MYSCATSYPAHDRIRIICLRTSKVHARTTSSTYGLTRQASVMMGYRRSLANNSNRTLPHTHFNSSRTNMWKKTTTHPINTWNDIFHAVRAPRTTLFSWVDSFPLRTLRYAETIEKISGIRLTKINKIIAKQVTDDEKLTISTLNSTYSSAIKIQDGAYDITELIQLLAQNVTSFTKRYQPTEHQPTNHSILNPLWKRQRGQAEQEA
jgi:hypothetical protein